MTHKATWPLKVHSRFRGSMLVATDVAWSLWLQAEVKIKLQRFDQLAVFLLHIRDFFLHFQAHVTHTSQHDEVRAFARHESSYLQTCRGCRPAAASAACWTSCLRPPAASSEGCRCPGSSPRGSEWDQHVPLKHKPMSANRNHTKPAGSFTPNTVEIAADIKSIWDFQSLIGIHDYYYRAVEVRKETLQTQRRMFVLILVKSCIFGEL